MEQRKKAKYFHLDSSHFFVPMAVETLGVMGPEAVTSLGTSAGESQQPPQTHVSPVSVAECGRSSPAGQCSGRPCDGREGLCCGV